MTEQTVILPATGRTVPAAAATYTLASLKQMNTMNGVAFTATVKQGKVTVGHIEQSGRGGMTFFHSTTAEHHKAWDAAEKDFLALPLEQGEEFKPETLADALFDEWDARKVLDRKGRSGAVLREAQTSGIAWLADGMPHAHVKGATAAEVLSAPTRVPVRFAEVWTADGWTAIPR